ncbi:hypothetical protein ABVK25_006660 [Lepraria finkii]|uniref:BRCT domain-containing protein n=1 Tax=Lepraria finkii TaxID=1340010 RepID=A0ABR4B583_9LECA
MFFTAEDSESHIERAVDEYGDSFARDVTVDELREARRSVTSTFPGITDIFQIFDSMPTKYEHRFSASDFRIELDDHDHELGQLSGWIFEGLLIYADHQLGGDAAHSTQKDPGFRTSQAFNTARFAGASMVSDLKEGVTHVLVGGDRSRIRALRQDVSGFKRLPHLVTIDWIEKSWLEKTLLDEERFAPT